MLCLLFKKEITCRCFTETANTLGQCQQRRIWKVIGLLHQTTILDVQGVYSWVMGYSFGQTLHISWGIRDTWSLTVSFFFLSVTSDWNGLQIVSSTKKRPGYLLFWLNCKLLLNLTRSKRNHSLIWLYEAVLKIYKNLD